MNKPKLKILGTNGNAFSILGKADKAAKQSGWSKEKIAEFTSEAMNGDYDHLLQTCMKYFEVS